MKNMIQKIIAWSMEHFQLRGASRLVWMGRKILMSGKFPVVTVWRGAQMRIDREVRSNVLYPYNLHTFDVALVAETFLKSGGVFLDVGGNVGYLTVVGAKLVGKSGQVLSVEPQPQMLEILRENVAINALSQVTIFPNAISPAPGRAMFSVATDPGLSRLTAAKSTAMGAELHQVEVETLRLDEVIARSGVGKVDFVKMDIEGFELEALKSAPLLLNSLRPAWILEVNRFSLEAIGGSAEMMRQMFVQANYEIYGIDSHQDKWFRVGRKPSLHVITNLQGLGEFFDILCVPCEKRASWLAANRGCFGRIVGSS